MTTNTMIDTYITVDIVSIKVLSNIANDTIEEGILFNVKINSVDYILLVDSKVERIREIYKNEMDRLLAAADVVSINNVEDYEELIRRWYILNIHSIELYLEEKEISSKLCDLTNKKRVYTLKDIVSETDEKMISNSDTILYLINENNRMLIMFKKKYNCRYEVGTLMYDELSTVLNTKVKTTCESFKSNYLDVELISSNIFSKDDFTHGNANISVKVKDDITPITDKNVDRVRADLNYLTYLLEII